MTTRRVLTLLFALVLAATVWPPALSAAVSTNLLSNPGCENGTTSLQGYQAVVTAVTTVKRSGNDSCRVTSTAGDVYSVQSTQSSSNPAAGQVFSGSAWVRADTTNGRSVFVAIRERGGSAASRTVYGSGVKLTTTWQLASATLTVASAGRTALDFYVVQDPGASGQVFYADDMDFHLASSSPSGQAVPTGDLSGWHQVFAEDFTVAAATGSWAGNCDDPDKIVYTGAGGTRWRTYPSCFTDTYQHRPYRSDQVLSVHDGVLDFSLHNVDGQPAGAASGPVVNNSTSSQYQTYGRYTYRFRTDTATLPEYYVAWLLWPADDDDWQCAESDFPEAGLGSTTVEAFAHYGCGGNQDQFSRSIDFTQWHTFTQEWAPGVRRYYLDGALIGTSTHSVFSQPERFQLQTETNGYGTHAGHLLLDWVAVYSYQP